MNVSARNCKRALKLAAYLVIFKTTAAIVLQYRFYFPLDFGTDFLIGRESYFHGAYKLAFFAHILSGPVCLLFGMVLVSRGFRSRWPAWHRSIGRIQILLIVSVLAPSGLLMARYADAGAIAAAGFGVLAILTGGFAALGWRAAMARDFQQHERWMLRCFLLLCSAVVLRLIGGATILWNLDPILSYSMAAWISWLAPLACYELMLIQSRSIQPHSVQLKQY